MKLKVKMIIMSHLSDIQEGRSADIGNHSIADKNHKINFAKFLLLKYSNTDVEVNADEEYIEFKIKHPNL